MRTDWQTNPDKSIVVKRKTRMITGEVRNKVDKIWEVFWTGGITNPLEVIEQFTYLLFIKQLDDVETTKETKQVFWASIIREFSRKNVRNTAGADSRILVMRRKYIILF